MKPPLTGRLLRRVLRRASSPEHAGFAARVLPVLDGAVPRSPSGAEFLHSSCTDEHWAARYLAARSLPRMVPDLIGFEETWALLLGLACDPVVAVREGVPFGLAGVVQRCPEAVAPLKRLIVDSTAASAERKAALRSLILLAVDPGTADVSEGLLRAAAHAGGWVTAGVGPVIIRRGIASRDPERATEILREWLDSGDPVLQEQATRALRPVAAREGSS